MYWARCFLAASHTFWRPRTLSGGLAHFLAASHTFCIFQYSQYGELDVLHRLLAGHWIDISHPSLSLSLIQCTVSETMGVAIRHLLACTAHLHLLSTSTDHYAHEPLQLSESQLW